MKEDELVIAVVGGGFGGSYFIKELEKLRSTVKQPLRVLLFEPRDSFVFTPLLHEVATAGLEMTQVTIPFKKIFAGKPWIRHVKERVIRVDRTRQRLFTAKKSYSYDHMILATGATTNYFGNTALQRSTCALKNEEDAQRLRLELEQALVDAAKTDDKQKQKNLLSIAVVGGGATGVELAPEILQFLRHRIKKQYRMIDKNAPNVTLFQGAPILLPAASSGVRDTALKTLRRIGVKVVLEAKVRGVKNKQVAYQRRSENLKQQANITVWVAGIISQTVKGAGNGRYYVNADLSFVDDDCCFAIGDAACYDESCGLVPTPALAQVAVQEGAHAARNLVRRINGVGTEPFIFKSKGFLVSLGQKRAVGELRTPLGTLFLKGFFMWWLWRTIYLFKFLDARHRVRTAASWTTRLFTKRSVAKKKKK